MKSFVVLFVTALMLLKPLWPLVEYIANYGYIVNVLCENRAQPQLECDGKCYLSKLLAKETTDNPGNPFEESRTHTELLRLVFFQPLPNVSLTTFTGKKDNANIVYCEILFSLPHLRDIVQPPEYLS
ncbi:MAG: hypothetical protein AAFX53_04380 [Bacteroidota bacterium]